MKFHLRIFFSIILSEHDLVQYLTGELKVVALFVLVAVVLSLSGWR